MDYNNEIFDNELNVVDNNWLLGTKFQNWLLIKFLAANLKW